MEATLETKESTQSTAKSDPGSKQEEEEKKRNSHTATAAASRNVFMLLTLMSPGIVLTHHLIGLATISFCQANQNPNSTPQIQGDIGDTSEDEEEEKKINPIPTSPATVPGHLQRENNNGNEDSDDEGETQRAIALSLEVQKSDDLKEHGYNAAVPPSSTSHKFTSLKAFRQAQGPPRQPLTDQKNHDNSAAPPTPSQETKRLPDPDIELKQALSRQPQANQANQQSVTPARQESEHRSFKVPLGYRPPNYELPWVETKQVSQSQNLLPTLPTSPATEFFWQLAAAITLSAGCYGAKATYQYRDQIVDFMQIDSRVIPVLITAEILLALYIAWSFIGHQLALAEEAKAILPNAIWPQPS